MYKRCKWNGKQCRPWSDCSKRSSLVLVYTVCPDLSICTIIMEGEKCFDVGTYFLVLPWNTVFVCLILYLGQKKIYVCFRFQLQKTRCGRSALSFYFIEIFYTESAFSLNFPLFFSMFDNILPTIHNKILRVEAKTYIVGRVGNPETHIHFHLALFIANSLQDSKLQWVSLKE